MFYLVELENWLESRANDALDVLSDIRYPAITIMRTFSYFLIFFFLVSSADMQAMSSLQHVLNIDHDRLRIVS